MTPLSLLRDFRLHVPAEADVIRKVFETRKPDKWNDAEILSWRREQQRLQLVLRYGWLLARQFLDEGGTPPADVESLPISYPPTVHSEMERENFRSGFYLGANISQPLGLDQGQWKAELANLERMLGVLS